MTRSWCFQSMFSASTALVRSVPRSVASRAIRCTRKTTVSFKSQQLARHCSWRQGKPDRDPWCHNYQFATYRHEKLQDATENGATHLHVHFSSTGQAARGTEERDLTLHWKPVCNELVEG